MKIRKELAVGWLYNEGHIKSVSEMTLKAAHSRIPVVATITTGTDLAVGSRKTQG